MPKKYSRGHARELVADTHHDLKQTIASEREVFVPRPLFETLKKCKHDHWYLQHNACLYDEDRRITFKPKP